MKNYVPGLLFVISITFTYINAANSQAQFLDRFDAATSASPYESAIAQAREEVKILLDSGAPGVSIAVGVDGQLIWAEGFGYANVEHRVSVTPLTKFRIGSVSKSMTSIALGLLVEQGLVDLDAPIQDYLSEFPAKEKGPVTLRLLASHRAGIRHYLPDGSDNFITDHYDNVVQSLEIFADDPLLFVPGEDYSYSSYGYNLISAVIQQVSGEDFISLMRKAVWAPLNLMDTVADHTDYVIENRAAPYTRRPNGQLRNAPYVDNSYKWAGGGFLSTPSDLVRFGLGVFSSDVLKQDTLKLLLSPPKLPDGTIADQNYGLGWQAYSDDWAWIGHGGGSVGGNTYFAVNPDKGVAVAITCNLTACLSGNRNLASIGELFAN